MVHCSMIHVEAALIGELVNSWIAHVREYRSPAVWGSDACKLPIAYTPVFIIISRGAVEGMGHLAEIEGIEVSVPETDGKAGTVQRKGLLPVITDVNVSAWRIGIHNQHIPGRLQHERAAVTKETVVIDVRFHLDITVEITVVIYVTAHQKLAGKFGGIGEIHHIGNLHISKVSIGISIHHRTTRAVILGYGTLNMPVGDIGYRFQDIDEVIRNIVVQILRAVFSVPCLVGDSAHLTRDASTAAEVPAVAYRAGIKPRLVAA